MRAVLCKNVPAMRDFRDVICPAAWKNPGSVCEHVVPFPVFPEIFFGFSAFRGRNFGRDFPAGRGKMVAGFIFFSFGWRRTGRFREILVLRLAKKMVFLRKFLSFVCHKIGRFWEILVLLLAKNGDSRKIFVLWMT